MRKATSIRFTTRRIRTLLKINEGIPSDIQKRYNELIAKRPAKLFLNKPVKPHSFFRRLPPSSKHSVWLDPQQSGDRLRFLWVGQAQARQTVWQCKPSPNWLHFADRSSKSARSSQTRQIEFQPGHKKSHFDGRTSQCVPPAKYCGLSFLQARGPVPRGDFGKPANR